MVVKEERQGGCSVIVASSHGVQSYSDGTLDTPLLESPEHTSTSTSSHEEEPPWLKRFRGFLIVFGAATFLSSSSFIPVFNKRLFDSGRFHYPLFTTTVYLLVCALGGLAYFSSKSAWRCLGGRGAGSRCHYLTAKYWKDIVKATWLLGIAFGSKLGLANIGLDLVSTDYHVLFASTSLVWVAVIGYAFLGEQPTTEVWCLTLFMTVGNIMLSLQFTSEKQATVLGLVTNLLVPVLQGVCIVLMRHASLVLFPQWMTKESSNSGRLSGGANSLRGFETRDFYFNLDTLVGYTSVKCFFSFLAALAAALAKEGYFADVPFWDALSIGIALDLVVGSVVTFFLQGSLVLLSMLSVALTTGVLSVLKVIPQTFAAIWFSSSVFDPTALHIAGVSIIILSSLAYAWLRLKH